MNDLNENHDGELRFEDVVGLVRAHIKLLTLGPLAAGVLALGVASVVPPTFTASTSFLLPQQQNMASTLTQGLGALSGLAGGGGLKNPAEQYMALLKSRSVQDVLIAKFGLKSRYGAPLMEEVEAELLSRVQITSGKDGLIRIEVDDKDPAFAAKLANAHLDELGKLMGRLALTEAQRRRMLYQRQLEETKNKLVLAQVALQRSGVREGTIRAEPKLAAETFANLKAQITTNEVKLHGLQAQMTEASPEVKATRSTIEGLKSQLSKVEADSGAVMDTYVERFREFKYQETLFEMYARQFELAKIDEAKDGALIQVVDPARPPEIKSKPKRGAIAILATFATAVLIFGWLLTRFMYKK